MLLKFAGQKERNRGPMKIIIIYMYILYTTGNQTKARETVSWIRNEIFGFAGGWFLKEKKYTLNKMKKKM